jgi:polyisoprenoid-binding protein YceI
VRRPIRILLVLVAAAVVLVVGGVAFYLAVLRDDPPERVALPEEDRAATEGDTGRADPSGPWAVQQGNRSLVGYRVSETFAGLSVASDAVGRTNEVEGTMSVDGETVGSATVTADLTTLESDEDRRDNAIRTRGLETDRYPEATFALTEPVRLPGPPQRGEDVSVTATGDLTLHGVTRSVDVPIDARWSGDTIDVVGTIPVLFADFDIEPPSVGGFVSVEDEGEIELQLRFIPA